MWDWIGVSMLTPNPRENWAYGRCDVMRMEELRSLSGSELQGDLRHSHVDIVKHWRNSEVLVGPSMACQRLRSQGVALNMFRRRLYGLGLRFSLHS